MADGFVELTKETLETPQGIAELNRMLSVLFDSSAGDTQNVRVFSGSGTPEGNVVGGVGSLYMRTDGGADTAVYRKETGTGATGWVAIEAGRTFTDRGDPASNDFSVGDFTTDGTWRDLDLSSIVPEGAIAVAISLRLIDNAVDSEFQLRKNGNSNARNRSVVATQIANVSIWADMIVACDSNRIIEYMGTNTSFSTINIVVKGWW